uniref:Uncharacterized protein n=1 Tax=Arundo donax TaxID=35708 RepID=A0A0A9UD28_ARUDO
MRRVCAAARGHLLRGAGGGAASRALLLVAGSGRPFRAPDGDLCAFLFGVVGCGLPAYGVSRRDRPRNGGEFWR